jgi:hypothetical protein
MGKRTLIRLAAVAAAGALAFAAAAPALADDTEATAVTTVPDSAFDPDTGLELQEVSAAEGPDDCDFLTVKLENETPPWSETVDGVTLTVDESATDPLHYTVAITGGVIHAAHVGIGNDARSYYFDPEVTSASNLTAPRGPKKQLRDVSHVWFCYEKVEVPPTPTPTPTPPPDDDEVKKIIKIIVKNEINVHVDIDIDLIVKQVAKQLQEQNIHIGDDDLKKIIKKILDEELHDDKDVDKKALADTGAPIVGMAVLGALMLAAGATMLGVRRRRLNFTDEA